MTITSIESGRNVLTDEAHTVLVTVVGASGSLAALAEQLPAHWRAQSADLEDIDHTDLLVIGGANGGRIRAAVRQHPGTPVVGVVDTYATADQVVEVLEAGADACVRSGLPTLVSSHLRACYRRRALAA
ncbi:hypothetical protein [Cryptosporangium sp. NPDC048952]|uniref:hypothetical protein n=1 Tax=Cryptosporangium sp. NPDC048952 TaxID=3363961 RepID=UPI003722BEFD